MLEGECGAVGRVSDCSPKGSRFEPLVMFLPPPQSSISVNLRQLCRTQRRRAERRTVRHPAPPPLLLLGWRNTRSVLLRPILFCIFGMCSPRRKSAATVWTVYRLAREGMLSCDLALLSYFTIRITKITILTRVCLSIHGRQVFE